MIKIQMNGKEHELERAMTIDELLESLNIPAAGTAVALNETIVPRDKRCSCIINENDRIEIIRAIGGG